MRTVADFAAGERVPAGQARAFVLSLAEALARWESSSVVYKVTPRAATVGPRGQGALVAESAAAETDEPRETRLLWTPPAQARGQAWDAAANRYALGLVMYRALTGVHPAHGERRVRLDASWSAPPFPEAIARELPLGVQATVLALLDPDEGARPQTALAIRDRVRASTKAGHARLAAAAAAAATSTKARDSGRFAALAGFPAPPRLTALVAFALASVAVAAAARAVDATSASRSEAGRATSIPEIAEARPVADMSPESCASCHVREVDEWRRSAMSFAATSPLFGALESAVEEQVGRDDECPNGAGALRAAGAGACRDSRTGVRTTGTGGEGWCTNCHIPASVARDPLRPFPAWSVDDARTRRPTRDLDPVGSREGIGCVACHAAIGPVADHAARTFGRPGRAALTYRGNATWTSPVTGRLFDDRPEDARGVFGIGNSGYQIDPSAFLLPRTSDAGDVHANVARVFGAASYERSSEACGACHDVRLFGSDVLGAEERGEHFKRLRNVYSEWRAWSDTELAAGRVPATCQDCHMSLYPGVCAPGDGPSVDASGVRSACPKGTHFDAKRPGERALGFVAPSSTSETKIAYHGFTSVERPLSEGFDDAWTEDPSLDSNGAPNGLRARRDLLLRRAFRFELPAPSRAGDHLSIPVRITNVGAGHRVPAGFSQERETWVELDVTDGKGARVYRVGHVDRPDEDLRDKVFARVSVGDDPSTERDRRGHPLGVFGADISDGPDAPRWTSEGSESAPVFRGQGLANLQNGFLRCVRCIGFIDASGACQADTRRGQGVTRADRYDDGAYDIDTGECRSNLTGSRALFETYFPIGSLDATRGVVKAPDAIVDTRSAPPNVPLTYIYDLDTTGHGAPFHVNATLHFRAFPPFLLRAFAAYEAAANARGERPSGPQIREAALKRLDILDLAAVTEDVP